MRYAYFLIFGVLSLTKGFSIDEISSNSAEKYIESMRHLNDAIRFSEKIENADVRHAIICHLESCEQCLQSEQNDTKLAHKLSSLHENIDEILADCDQYDLKLEIAACIEQVTEQFQE